MKKNMGSADRLIRILLTVIVVILFAMDIISGTLGIVLMVAAGILVLTSFVSFCPIYRIFGISTCTVRSREQND